LPKCQDRAEIQAKLFWRVGYQYLPLFEPDNPVAVLRLKLYPRGKRKGPGFRYHRIDPKIGLVRNENTCFAEYNTEENKPATNIKVLFQRGQDKKVHKIIAATIIINEHLGCTTNSDYAVRYHLQNSVIFN